MKTSWFLYSLLLSCLFHPIPPSLAEGSGGVVGNSGSVVCDENGKNCVSADLYFKEREYRIPDYYLKRLDLSQDAEFMKEWGPLARLICVRSRLKDVYCGDYAEKLLRNFEIYSATRLSGSDPIKVDGRESTPVAYTFSVKQKDPDLVGEIQSRYIELDEKIFPGLKPRQKALVVLHEIAHHKLRGHDPEHELISPWVQSMNLLMDVRKRQLRDDWRPVSETEFAASQRVQNVLDWAWDDDKLGEVIPWESHVDPRHGGLVLGILDMKKDFDPSNRIGVSSRAWIEFSDPRQFIGNTLVDSEIAVGWKSGRPCAVNRFVESYGFLDCEGSENSFVRVVGHRSEGRFYLRRLFGDHNEVRDSGIFSLTVEISGDHNVVRRSTLSAGVRLGSGNTLEDSTLSSGALYRFPKALLGWQLYFGGENVVHRLTVRRSRVNVLQTAAPMTLEDVILPRGVMLQGSSTQPTTIRGLRVTLDSKIVRPGTAGLVIDLDEGQAVYSFDPSKAFDANRFMLENPVRHYDWKYTAPLPPFFLGEPLEVPTREVSSQQELEALFDRKRK